MDSGSDPIEDDEFLYRRVPASMDWYDANSDDLRPEAFGPHKTRDNTGLSVTRANRKSIKEAARGQPGKSYYVAIFRAGSLREQGIEVVPRPNLPNDEYDPAHAELPELNSGTRKESQTLQWQRVLAEELTERVEGPFLTSPDDSA